MMTAARCRPSGVTLMSPPWACSVRPVCLTGLLELLHQLHAFQKSWLSAASRLIMSQSILLRSRVGATGTARAAETRSARRPWVARHPPQWWPQHRLTDKTSIPRRVHTAPSNGAPRVAKRLHAPSSGLSGAVQRQPASPPAPEVRSLAPAETARIGSFF